MLLSIYAYECKDCILMLANRKHNEDGNSPIRIMILYISKVKIGASLVAQWLRIRLPMQGTRVRALVWEDPTCRGATGPREPQLLSLRVWSLCSATREAAILRGPRTAMKSGPRLPHN